MSINQRIRQIRQSVNLSQAKFAKVISISNGYIAGIELGHRAVNERIIKLICIYFHVNEEWLKSGTGEMFQSKAEYLSEEELRIFAKLKPEFQEYVLKQIHELLNLQNKLSL